MNFLTGATILAALSSLGLCQNTTSAVAALATASPTCIQSRQASDPASTSISSALKTVISDACDTTQQRTVTSPALSLVYYQFGAVYFNISHSVNATDHHRLSPSSCSAIFDLLISACINAPEPGFWGGWIAVWGTNYSISDLIYPANPLAPVETPSGVSASSASVSATRPSGSSKFLQGSLLFTGSILSTTSLIATPAPAISSSQSVSYNNVSAMTSSGNASSLPLSSTRIGIPHSIDSGATTLPLPSLATIITGTVGSQVVTETFVPHIFPQYSTLSKAITTTTILTPGSKFVTVVVGPLGVGWAPYHEPSGIPGLPPPFVLPSSAAAAIDSGDSTSSDASSASVLPII